MSSVRGGLGTVNDPGPSLYPEAGRLPVRMGEEEHPVAKPGPEDALRALPERLGRAMTVIRDAMRAIAASQEDIEARLREVSGEQQERFIEFAKAYAERARALEDRVGEAVKAAEEAAGSAIGAIEAQREGLAAEIAARIDVGSVALGDPDSARGLQEMATAQREIEQAFRAMRAEVERVRKRIEEWGKARSNAAIADQVTGLEERISDLEGAVGDRLAEAVGAQVERLFERRFEALVQLLESRLRQAAEPQADEPRGLFRRSR